MSFHHFPFPTTGQNYNREKPCLSSCLHHCQRFSLLTLSIPKAFIPDIQTNADISLVCPALDRDRQTETDRQQPTPTLSILPLTQTDRHQLVQTLPVLPSTLLQFLLDLLLPPSLHHGLGVGDAAGEARLRHVCVQLLRRAADICSDLLLLLFLLLFLLLSLGQLPLKRPYLVFFFNRSIGSGMGKCCISLDNGKNSSQMDFNPKITNLIDYLHVHLILYVLQRYTSIYRAPQTT